jgi:hypothetical protein
MTHRISIAENFSPYPAGRYPEDGPFNGTKFRDKELLPALQRHERVIVDIDGVALLPSSFWEETWGGLVRIRGFTEADLRKRVEIVTSDPELSTYSELAWEMVHDEELRRQLDSPS